MALICVGCRTENRDAAKFCKGCGGKLVSLPTRSAEEEEALDDAWGATVLASDDDLRPAPSPVRTRGPASRASRPSSLQDATGGLRSVPARLGVAGRAAPRDRSTAWVLLAAAAIVLLSGGWYAYRRMLPAPTVVVPVAPPTPPVSAALPAPAPATATAPALAPSPAPQATPPLPLEAPSSPTASTASTASAAPEPAPR